ncbi:MAG: transcriptional repressor [Epulopiscium sp.]|nr:transcriptional repressor [Candidatus Epulonipiscium sp.]
MKEIADLLKVKGLKVTPQRIAIFHMLYNTAEHPSAEVIYKSLQETHPTMSLATVYKTLDALKKAELVQELNVGEDSFRYDAMIHSHPHVICMSCNMVHDLHTDILADLKGKVAHSTDFELVSEQIYFYGICPTCQKN